MSKSLRLESKYEALKAEHAEVNSKVLEYNKAIEEKDDLLNGMKTVQAQLEEDIYRLKCDNKELENNYMNAKETLISHEKIMC